MLETCGKTLFPVKNLIFHHKYLGKQNSAIVNISKKYILFDTSTDFEKEEKEKEI